MTIEDIQKRIDAIKAIRGDNEAAHSLEDSLYIDFIEYVATSKNRRNLDVKAKLVLTAGDIKFSRWYA